MISNLVGGSADMICTGFGWTSSRAKFVNYLPGKIVLTFHFSLYIHNKNVALIGITSTTPGVFINSKLAEDVNWFMFVKPFASGLWGCVLAMTFLIALILFLINNAFCNTTNVTLKLES